MHLFNMFIQLWLAKRFLRAFVAVEEDNIVMVYLYVLVKSPLCHEAVSADITAVEDLVVLLLWEGGCRFKD